MKILVTGGTGFIGSAVVRSLLLGGHEVIALKREQSSLGRCQDFVGQVEWINLDAADWNQRVSAAKPEAIIHCAWAGVMSAERLDWKLQASNLELFADLLHIAKQAGCQQFIGLGSQAEYGLINGRVGENHPCRPVTAYGATKLACLALLESFARQQVIRHVWLRLFSVYGPGEGSAWFVPSLIRQFQAGESPRLTGCEQRYDYLHVRDLAAGVVAVLQHPEPTGVFNFGSNTSMPLKELVGLVKKISGSQVTPVFGALSYAPNQSMHMEGDSTRFHETFAFKPATPIIQGLQELIEPTNFS